MAISDKGCFGLIGCPLSHSFSKEVHEAAGRYSFELFDVAYDEMCDMLRRREFSGLCVTRPYKREVMSFCDRLTERAEKIGAVNALYFDGDTLVGHNTDYDGFLYTASSSGISFRNRTVLVLGSGGASRTVRAVLDDEGAEKVYIASRSPGEHCGDTFLPGEFISYDEAEGIAASVDVVVNASPVGTFPDNKGKPISLSGFSSCEAVIDVVYNPRRTRLLMEAESLGMKTSDGLPMLVSQAMAAAGCFMTGDIVHSEGGFMDEVPRILSGLRRKMDNIVIIGMPGCGKTTMGRWIADKTGMEFIDLDDEISREYGKSIPEIFKEGEEALFRDLESEVCERKGALHGCVIAAGGGVVVRPENYEALHQNGHIIWLTRPVSELSREGRPLSSSAEAVRALYDERKELYRNWADVTGDADEIRQYIDRYFAHDV